MRPSPQESAPMRWIATTGGPLVLIGRRQLPSWRGVPDDYVRACDVQGFVGALPLADSQALVLGDEPMPTAVRPGPGGIVLLVRWCYADGAQQVADHLAALRPADLSSPDLAVDLGDTSARLFDASLPGDRSAGDPDAFTDVVLAAPRVSVSVDEFRPDARTFLVIHALTPVS